MTYSLDFRRKVFKIKEEKKLTYEKTSERFGVGIRTLFRWQEKMEPETTKNRPATKIDMEKLKKDVKLYPDDFQYERAGRFNVSSNGILYALRRLNITNKKNPVSSKGKSA